MAHTHRYSVHMTSPCVKLTTSCFFKPFFFFFRWVLWVYRNVFAGESMTGKCCRVKWNLWTISISECSINVKPNLDYSCGVKMLWVIGLWFCDSVLVKSHTKAQENQFSICLYSTLIPWKNMSSDLDMCRLAACFPLSALSPQLCSSLFLSLSPSVTHWEDTIPGRINAQLNWINIIQTCSIPARLSWKTCTVIPDSIKAKIRCQLRGQC